MAHWQKELSSTEPHESSLNNRLTTLTDVAFMLLTINYLIVVSHRKPCALIFNHALMRAIYDGKAESCLEWEKTCNPVIAYLITLHKTPIR